MHAPTSVRRTPALSWPPPIRWSARMSSTLTPSAAERPELGAIREHMLIDGQPVRSGQGEPSRSMIRPPDRSSRACRMPAPPRSTRRCARRGARSSPAPGATCCRPGASACAGAGRSGRAPRRRAGAPGNAEQWQAAGRGPGAGGRLGRAMAALHGRLGHQDHGRDAVAVDPLPAGNPVQRLYVAAGGGRGRRHHSLEFPAADGDLEDRACAGGRLHRGAQARRGNAADRVATG